MPSYDIAIVYLGLGEKEEVYRCLEKALDERSAWMAYLNMDPRLDGLRSELRFKELVRRRLGLCAFYWYNRDVI